MRDLFISSVGLLASIILLAYYAGLLSTQLHCITILQATIEDMGMLLDTGVVIRFRTRTC